MDKYDIPFIVEDINNKMPLHTDNTAKVPYSFSKNMPKSLIEESHNVDNKFLNNHLGEIEEAIDRKFIPKQSFIEQQIQYHGKSDILNHDGIFHADLATGCPIGIDNNKHYPFIINPYRFVVACTGGSEVQVDGSDNTYHSSNNNLYAGIITGAQAGYCYDQIAISTKTAVGNKRMATYTNGSTYPNALISETASVSQTVGYNYVSMPEWTQDGTTNVWCAYNNDDQDNEIYNLQSGIRKYTGTTTYGTMPDPFTTGSSGDTYPHKQKIGHS
jgi:hypothetical protein